MLTRLWNDFNLTTFNKETNKGNKNIERRQMVIQCYKFQEILCRKVVVIN
jgi:hypothetical protein